jgi:hypothetical protein
MERNLRWSLTPIDRGSGGDADRRVGVLTKDALMEAAGWVIAKPQKSCPG